MPVPPEIMARVYDSILPQTGMDAVLASSMAMSAKAQGISQAGETGIKLTTLAVDARSKTETWADDDALKLAIEAMLVTLMNNVSEVGGQAAKIRLP